MNSLLDVLSENNDTVKRAFQYGMLLIILTINLILLYYE